MVSLEGLEHGLEPDAIVRVRFKTPAEGGRKRPVVIGDQYYGCPLFVGDEGFDCKVLLKNQTLDLGVEYELPIKFLLPDFALPVLSIGTPIRLWEMGDIATGNVLRLCESRNGGSRAP